MNNHSYAESRSILTINQSHTTRGVSNNTLTSFQSQLQIPVRKNNENKSVIRQVSCIESDTFTTVKSSLEFGSLGQSFMSKIKEKDMNVMKT
jgi:hypothetical protein